ncbi:simple sugar transport system permease protein [Rhodobium orientis]|uniref:Sugar ABC transporter permease n=1 Tax=Rhodobium orientis TaxID=34017 RepID=A0A327JQE4_9HYPH|nr:ABC transporter permease [Rhodobium orientis]MBB4301390.1 simple sugar transport system permease protein [Rhodobium orientis]MBK5951023.1 sugar ABC transporter permease [Rhodobium orientis]RAI27614.1 sugar ABC transporter permease [Rhodobium orientis]
MDRQLNFLVALNALVLVAAVAIAGQNFINIYNLQSMATQIPELGLLAIGVTLAMISGNGGIDLSGIAVANLAGIVSALLVPMMVSPDELPMAYAFVFAGVCLVVGLACGLVNGLLISRAGLTPIIATLGTSLAFTGVSVVLTNGSGVRLGYIEPLDNFIHTPILGVPICFAVFLGIAIAIGASLRFAPFGMRLYMLGSNAKAARFAGFNQKRLLMTAYTLSSVLASVAGFIIAARISSVKWDYGTSYVLIAILIAVMAGVRPTGGYGKITCVVLSASALQMLSSMFNFLNISNFFRDFAWGLLLLIFLAVSRFDFRTLLSPQTKPGG